MSSIFNILVFHNILWSKYKGGVFSKLHALAVSQNISLEICQIAETEADRMSLSGVDLTYHSYPYLLLFKGAYSSISKFRLIYTLFRYVYFSKADLVLLPGYHTVEYWAMLVAAKLRFKLIGVFCDSTVFDRPRSKSIGVLKRLFFSQCDVFFGYGERSHDYLKMYGANPANIYFRCQAAALPHDYDPSIVPQRRLELAAPRNEPRFLYVGRLSPEKGLDTQLLAFNLILISIPKAKLVLVGSGPSRAELQDLTSRLGIMDSVEFTGPKDVDALRDEYLRATCFLLPSTSEPWGLVVNEALAYGCPVVVSHRCGCTPELVIDGVTGFLFTSGDVNDLADKMVRVINEFADPFDAANKCLSVISNFTPEAAARQILEGCKAALDRL